MKFADISRRRFVQAAGAVAATPLSLTGAEAPTAQEIVERMLVSLGGQPLADGRDGFKAGDPSTPVQGIATTAMATMDVLRQAAAARTNLIFCHEPTFFCREDGPASSPPVDGAGGGQRRFRGLRADDAVYLAKKEFIEKNELVIYRLHDNWLSRRQRDMTTGLADALGWAKYRADPDDSLYEIPRTTAQQAVRLIRQRLNLRGGLRAVGDRTATVRRVLLLPGFTNAATMWERYAEADLTVTGEVREWENTFYAADMFTAGSKRGLVTVGRVASEDPGMRICADWIETIVEEVPTRWIPSGDLYWRAV
jgi:putative NIF3 family GTP cyclohydrolase 1 type 2